MKHLRKYIRKIIQEVFNTPNPENIHDRLAFTKTAISLHSGSPGMLYTVLDPRKVIETMDSLAGEAWQDILPLAIDSGLVGMMSIGESAFDCNGAWTVDSVAALSPLGPTVYDIVAMDPELLGGIIADRRMVKPKAQRVYQYYWDERKQDLEEVLPLDDVDSPVTADIGDDCGMSTLIDPSRTPIVDLAIIASLAWLEENYPNYYAPLMNKWGGHSLENAAYWLGDDWERGGGWDNDNLVGKFFILKLEKSLKPGQDIPVKLENDYYEFVESVLSDSSELMKYSFADTFSERAMNFSYKVKKQPEWDQMLERGNGLLDHILDTFPECTEDYLDQVLKSRSRIFFQNKYK